MAYYEICCICKVKDGNLWGYCKKCFNEKNVVHNQCRIARENGLAGDLTHEEWRATIKAFNGMCAYCQQEHYQVLEHFIPISHGGGTTKSNCVPACMTCNARKGGKRPPGKKRIPDEDIERVRVFLSLQNS